MPGSVDTACRKWGFTRTILDTGIFHAQRMTQRNAPLAPFIKGDFLTIGANGRSPLRRGFRGSCLACCAKTTDFLHIKVKLSYCTHRIQR
ncbi:MAG: hypothetical protein BROFUL_00933 [Candidatus Brocadia fulgida]|uniref:Uncharacterized protein n=1 Tax=Candidatus Brocadia fulgida TaxID=380242 RepID=A0A0M2UZD8_9BACT|nr:MAG: hypothetical protein BROFUL_00933 [Candidatus Brocadia fulgida]